MGGNKLIGAIPTEFDLCINFLGLELDQNFLNGTIPTQIGLMSALSMSQVMQSIPFYASFCGSYLFISDSQKF